MFGRPPRWGGTLDQEVTSLRWQEVEVTGQRSEEVEMEVRAPGSSLMVLMVPDGSDGS